MTGRAEAGIPFVAVLTAAALLAWPAVHNGYPLVFADSGTYLRQALEFYVGWDRLPFYSLFLRALHLSLTTWTPALAQALIAAWLLALAARVFGPVGTARYLAAIAALAIASALPWFAVQLMPDIFTALLVPCVALLVLAPERLGRLERWIVTALFLGAIMVHQTHLPLSLGLLAVLLPFRRWLGAEARLGWPDLGRALAPPALAVAGAVLVNALAHGLPGLSPFGQIFLLARLLGDGPARETLARECPRPDWRLCDARDRIPANPDVFLWNDRSPLYDGDGPKSYRQEAAAIVAATLSHDPLAVAHAAALNALRQVAMFATGDGLEPYPGDPGPDLALSRHFPAGERARFQAARQARDRLSLPHDLAPLHAVAGVLGVGLCALVLRRRRARGLVLGVLLLLVGNAVLTGALSGPHDRYQARVMWLPLAVGLLLLNRSSGRGGGSASAPAA